MTTPLVRSRDNKVFSGVCAGMAVYFDMDPTLMRVLWVLVAVFTGGIMLLVAYIILAVVIPEGDPVPRTVTTPTQGS